jgi:hypothetical protein
LRTLFSTRVPASRTISSAAPGRELRPQRLDALLHAVAHRRGAVALALDDVEADGLAPVEEGRRAALRAPGRDRGHGAERHRGAVAGGDRELEEVLGVGEAALEADGALDVGVGHLPHRRREVLRPERADHLIHPHPRRREALRVERDVERRRVGAGDRHLGHARDGAEVAADDLVGDHRELRRVERLRREGERDDRQLVGVEPLHDGLDDLLRQLRALGADGVAHVLRRLVDRLAELELHDHLREAVGARRAQLLEPGDAREAVLEPVDHLALDLLGRRARVGDADEDDRARRCRGTRRCRAGTGR